MELLLCFLLFLFTLAAVKYAFWKIKSNRIIRSYTDLGMIYLGNSMVNILRVVLKGEHYVSNIAENYAQLKKAKQSVGFEFGIGQPSFFVTDLDLIKAITTKDFDHFSTTFNARRDLIRTVKT